MDEKIKVRIKEFETNIIMPAFTKIKEGVLKGNNQARFTISPVIFGDGGMQIEIIENMFSLGKGMILSVVCSVQGKEIVVYYDFWSDQERLIHHQLIRDTLDESVIDKVNWATINGAFMEGWERRINRLREG